MSGTLHRPRAYLKASCPFCLKFRIFLTEAGLAHELDHVVFENGDEVHRDLRARLAAVGLQPSFPAVEFAQDSFLTGTDDLIARFAAPAGVQVEALPLLRYYVEGVFPRYGQMFRELKSLKTTT